VTTVCRKGDFVFLAKPSGVHSVRLAGGGGSSVEDALETLFPEPAPRPTLLQRLDLWTSGLVCAAMNGAAVAAFRKEERLGRCIKGYIALLAGRMEGPRTARNGLDTANRRKARVLSSQAPPLRWTMFTPIATLHRHDAASITGTASCASSWSDAGATLALCVLRCGARHQIRAHASALGHPLLGDTLYCADARLIASPQADGAPAVRESSPPFLLHQAIVAFPQTACILPPSWRLPQSLEESMRTVLDIGQSRDILAHFDAHFAPAIPAGQPCSPP
jgi:23S rRNA pseudouridine1911/1915/1917 synthase